jgi:hypothetical protein
MATRLPGGCLCGAVRFSALPEKMTMDVCHCSMCRRWSGGAWMTVFCTDVAFEDESAIGVFNSSDWAERGYCTKCGSTLFWRTKDRKMNTVSAQSFDDPSVFHFEQQIYIDSKPPNYEFANDTLKKTGAEIEAEFNAQQQKS